MRAPPAFFLALIVAGCANNGVDPADLPSRITCTATYAVSGAACDTEDQWCATTDQCGLAVSYCQCSDGHYRCTEPYSPDEIRECTVIAEASCYLEGTGVCDQEPVGGGSCGCSDGAWVCHRSCDGCPSTQPATGQACSTENTCRYSGTTATSCTCTNGVFDCHS